MSRASAVRESPGFTAIVVLAALTGIEYVLSAGDVPGSFALLTIIALLKAIVILIAFMHFRNVLQSETP